MSRRKRNDCTYKPYDPNFHPQDLLERMASGQYNVQIYADWNICEDTFYRWRREHPELEEAYKLGLPKFEKVFLEKTFIPMMEGKLEGRHSFNSAIAIANNKLGWIKGTIQGNVTNNTQINVSQMNVLTNKSPDELKKLIQSDLEYLSDMHVIEGSFTETPQLEDHTDDDTESNE